MKNNVRFLVPLHYTFHDMIAICLNVKHSFSQFFLAFIYYDASQQNNISKQILLIFLFN